MPAAATGEIDAILADTLDDARLSRTERRALDEVLVDLAADARLDLAYVRSRAFALAREAMLDKRDGVVLRWLEDVVKTVVRREVGEPSAALDVAEAFFSPDDRCVERLRGLFRNARKRVDVCVFTITDNRITDAICDAADRGVRVRVITDNDKQYDRGSDVDRLHREGIEVRVDLTEHHMHHKFAVFDSSLLVCGSYNWTRSASKSNEEDFVVVSDRRLVKPFLAEFEKLWADFG